jgi:hypothetical protein
VPGINAVDELMTWWLTDVRHQFGGDWEQLDAPLLPSERKDPDTGRVLRAGADALRTGFGQAVARWLPDWDRPDRRLTPHGMRHYCASSLYAQGVGLKAIQELLGHSWLSTTTLYVHVHDDHIEQSWIQANQRVTARLIDNCILNPAQSPRITLGSNRLFPPVEFSINVRINSGPCEFILVQGGLGCRRCHVESSIWGAIIMRA